MNLDIVLNSRHHFSDKGPYSKGCGLSSCHAWLWEMDCKEGTVLKHLCFQTVVLEKSHEISLDSKESKPVNLKGNQLWILIRRTDVESEVPILWSPDVKRLVIGNDPDAGKDWRQKKGMTENDAITNAKDMNVGKLCDMVMDGKTCSPWGRKESGKTGWLNNNCPNT